MPRIRAADVDQALDAVRAALSVVSATRAALGTATSAHHAASADLDRALAAYETLDAAYRAQMHLPPDPAAEKEAARLHATMRPIAE